MTETQLLADLDRALAATQTAVAGIGAGKWQAPTPCTELDVHGVLNHLVEGNLVFAALAGAEPPPDRGAEGRARFAAAVPVAADAPAIDRLAGFLGRPV